MDIDKVKQIVKDSFSPYSSKLEPNNEKHVTFDLIVYKDKTKNPCYISQKLNINNISKIYFKNLILTSKKSLKDDLKFVFDEY